ncbi:DUF6758 family protein [Catelliglobosispora koreensis]|uniref:DUF6758 family protein n=1 Tax=Catelliglobosispora koreensis TaxID=129052 RepID=UPI00035E8BB6|nr:DUF6758 family protein [Catelliglobosispora koreensis]
MGLAVTCPRCGGRVRPPGLSSSQWLCHHCGPTVPLHTVRQVNAEVLASVAARAGEDSLPLWCPWPMPAGWMVTGLAWAGDDRGRLSATAIACTGPTPLGTGPADIVLVAEEPGLGFGARIAGIAGPDPGPVLAGLMAEKNSHAKIRVAGHPTPLWSVDAPGDRSAYAGEAKGRWLYAVTWPAQAGYLLAETPTLHDLGEWLPGEIVFGAPTPFLATPE